MGSDGVGGVCCFLRIRRPPRATRSDRLLPYTTRFRATLLLRMGKAQALPGQIPATRDTPLLRPFGTSFGTVNGGVKAGAELLLHFGALSKRRFRQCFGFGVPCLGSLPALPIHDDFSIGFGLGGKRQSHCTEHNDSGSVDTDRKPSEQDRRA